MSFVRRSRSSSRPSTRRWRRVEQFHTHKTDENTSEEDRTADSRFFEPSAKDSLSADSEQLRDISRMHGASNHIVMAVVLFVAMATFLFAPLVVPDLAGTAAGIVISFAMAAFAGIWGGVELSNAISIRRQRQIVSA